MVGLSNSDDFGVDLGDLDPDRWLWLPGVDYEAGWRAARGEAVALNGLFAELGFGQGELRAIADTDALGGAVVRLVGVPGGWRRLELVLRLARERGGSDSLGEVA